jgi:hypothetical protein
MRYHRRRGWEIRASETTPESIFLDRRAFVAGAGAIAAYAGLTRPAGADESDPSAGSACLNRFPRTISGVLPVLSGCVLPRVGCDGGRA